MSTLDERLETVQLALVGEVTELNAAKKYREANTVQQLVMQLESTRAQLKNQAERAAP